MAAQPTAEDVLGLFDESQPVWNITLGEVAVLRQELERLRRLEQLALIWSAYQDDDSKRDQQTDAQLRQQAEDAETNLYSAVA
jgi:hypothetical protein